MKKLKVSEHDIQNSILNYLEVKGYYTQRMNSGRVIAETQGRKRMLWLCKGGTPDIMAFKPNVFASCKCGSLCPKLSLLFIEVKSPGNKPTLLQAQRMKEIESYGGRCLVATSIEDLEKAGI